MKTIASFSLLLLTGMVANAWAKDTPADTAQIKRGEYPAIAADCAACHTAPAGKGLADADSDAGHHLQQQHHAR